MKLVLLILGLFGMVIFGCFSQNEVLPRISCGELPLWIGQKVILTGCLRFICPSLIGAHFPEDCIPCLRDESGVAYLEFSESAVPLREMLNTYYRESFARCVLLCTQGKVGQRTCEVPGCVSWIFLEVEDIWFSEEGLKKSSLNR
ncbi:MAG: hypothetical protein N2205_02235 [Candidatus Caldatribacterium sp.]|nr:hypothetical protein [Candidatus Caldatribacterium sp.]